MAERKEVPKRAEPKAQAQQVKDPAGQKKFEAAPHLHAGHQVFQGGLPGPLVGSQFLGPQVGGGWVQSGPQVSSGWVQSGPPQVYQSGAHLVGGASYVGQPQVIGGYTQGQIYQSGLQQVGYQTVPVETIQYQQVPVEKIEYQTVPVIQQTAQLRESIRGESYVEYVPFERLYYEQVPVERIEYVPVEKKYTDYYAIEKQTEYVPYTRYETVREMVPQQRTEYVPQTKVDYVPQTRTEMVPVERVIQEMVPQQITEYVAQTRVEQIPQVRTEMVPVDRVQEKVEYQAMEKTLVHYPQVEKQFIAEAERSGRIRTDLTGQVIGGGSVVGGGLVGGSVVGGGLVGGPVLGGSTYRSGVIGGPVLGGPVGGPVLGGGVVGGPVLGGSYIGGSVIGGPVRTVGGPQVIQGTPFGAPGLATSISLGKPAGTKQKEEKLLNRLEKDIKEMEKKK